MKSCTDWHRLDTGTKVHLERTNLSFYWTSEQSFSSNSCWHNHIKNTSLNLTFNIFIRLTHYLYFAASVVVTVQSKSVKDYSLQFFLATHALNLYLAALAVVVTVQSKSVRDYTSQFSVRITALSAELKHFDDHNCAKCGKHFLNQTPFWSFSNGHVISATTNHWTGKLTELHLLIAILWFTDAWLDFSISKSRLICAKLCQIIESKSSKEEKTQSHFQSCSCLSHLTKSEIPVPVLPLQDPLITFMSLKQ